MTTMTRWQIRDLADCRAEINEIKSDLAAGRDPVATTLPNGRHVLVTAAGFAVQPPNDNYWVEARTIRQALRKAGWRLRDAGF